MESPGTVSAAVWKHLRQLSLREFPCGRGSWNRSRFLPQTQRSWRELVPREEEPGSTEEEPVDALLDLVRSPHSPWALLQDSSKEDAFLRELAIRDPLKITDAFFYSYFRCLRVVDKEVSLVDRGLLKFLNLEELVLSANRIKVVDAANLPPTLKVLELYGNEVSSMQCLCDHPPPGLQHLGLGHNKLQGPLESLYVTADHWPNLVSLDLSFNNLTDLQSMLGAVRSLRQLRLLLLQGNPLGLVPYYRGLAVDSLPHLCVLDDITVSPNEKHQFRGLSVHADLLAHEAQLVVTIGNLQGVLDASVLDPETGPEGPFVSYTYYVTYDFLEQEDPEANVYRGALAGVRGPGIGYCGALAEVPGSAGRGATEDFLEEELEEAEGSLESVALTGSPELEGSASAAGSTDLRRSAGLAEELAKLRPRIDPRLCPSPGTVLFSTVPKPWSDVITCNYEMLHTLRDLVALKAFLLSGTTVTIVQEKILSWPLVAPQGGSTSPGKKGKPGKETKDPQNQKGSKKKKEIPKELQHDPPILKVLGSTLVSLEALLAGEAVVSTVCNFGVIRTVETDLLTFARDAKRKKKKKVAKKGENQGVSLLSEGDQQPDPLTVEVQIQLSQCRTAEEAIRAYSV
ncbi:PREDICTED: leucine-rich repeat-containing protein 43 [Elephantulus edwardii]|uniref:leucine-rich repeat-containing protein 43 n=1 Tax=Elephantulus edwardii TaxID=28737 RepID=UPI0003F07384|nr:PREDICTED: leucine-rich repeat-containing protein 43 [Elephantulus edwardii]